jgi:ComF family protein
MSLFYPDLCCGCSEVLLTGEAYLCADCLARMSCIHYARHDDNSACDKLLLSFPVQKAAAYLRYRKESVTQSMVVAFKYHGNESLGRWLGQRAATEYLATGFFEGIDYLVPVPLHRKKQWNRGFNQTEIFARGIAEVTHLPIETSVLYRTRANPTQTRQTLAGRKKNVESLFQVRETGTFKDKHILLIDDVLTTGATLGACGQALLSCENIRLSVLVLATA